jgi:putative peptidoglycan lipid II flippase
MLVNLGILLSKTVGLVRQSVLAHYLGTTGTAGALVAAFRIGNITQNLLGEGTLSATFIPVYVTLRTKDAGSATRFARAAFGALLPIVVVASALGALGAPLLAGVIAAGFKGDKLDLTIQIARIVFPMTGVLVLGAWALGVLNAHRRFFLPYAAPVLWSVAQIGALIFGSLFFHLSGDGLAVAVGWGALVGAVVQVLVMLPVAHKLLGSAFPIFDLGAEGLGESAKRLPGAVLGRGVVQISGLIDTAIVGFLGPAAVAIFGYAQNIYLLPMSILGAGEAAAALPELAERTTAADPEVRARGLRKELGRSLARILTLSAMSTAVFAVLGDELITLMLQSGRFDRSSTAEVKTVLAAYAAGLPGNAMCRLLTTTCFALGDTKRPASYAVWRVAVSTAIAVALMKPLGVSGVVLGAVFGAWAEFALLGRAVRKQIHGLGMDHVPFARIALATALGVGAGLAARYALASWPFAELALASWIGRGRLAATVVLTVAGGVFLAACQKLGVMSVRALLRR